mgnify:CR=1 FL=1
MRVDCTLTGLFQNQPPAHIHTTARNTEAAASRLNPAARKAVFNRIKKASTGCARLPGTAQHHVKELVEILRRMRPGKRNKHLLGVIQYALCGFVGIIDAAARLDAI